MHRGSLANRGRDRGFGAMGRGRGGPGQEQAHSDIDRWVFHPLLQNGFSYVHKHKLHVLL